MGLVAVQVGHQTDAEERKIQSLGLMRLELSQLCCRRGLPVPCRSSRWAAPRRRRHQVEGDHAHRVGGVGGAGSNRRGTRAGCLCFRDICKKVVRIL